MLALLLLIMEYVETPLSPTWCGGNVFLGLLSPWPQDIGVP